MSITDFEAIIGYEFNDKEFMSLTIDNPEHHALSDDKGNGYSKFKNILVNRYKQPKTGRN